MIKEPGNLFLVKTKNIYMTFFFFLWWSSCTKSTFQKRQHQQNDCIARCRWDSNMFLMTKEKHWHSRRNACSALKRIDKNPHHFIYKQGKNVDVEWRKWIKWGVLLCFAKVFFQSKSNMICCIMLYSLPRNLPEPRILTSLKPQL